MRTPTISSAALVAALLVACSGRTANDEKWVVGVTQPDAGDRSDVSSVQTNPQPGGDAAATPPEPIEGDTLADAIGFSADGAGAVSPTGAPGSCTSLTITDPGNSTQPVGPCICTRRDANPNGMCAKGVGQSASATIGPEGGTLKLMGQQGAASGVPFTLTIPPTALATPTAVTVTELSDLPPNGFVDWSPVYRVDPVDAVLTTPASLNIPFNNGRGSSAYDQNLSIFWSGQDTCTLQRLPSSYPNAGFAQGSTTRFGYAIVGYAHAGNATYCM